MKMNKKMNLSVILLVMVLVIVVISSGCAKSGDSNDSSSSTGDVATDKAADDYPKKNIEVIVPTSEGGAMDRAVRAFTSVWSKELGVNFEPSFYKGASGEVGYEFFLNKPSDGYTLLAGNIGPEVMMYGLQSPKFKFPEDYVYFATMDADPAVIWVPKNSPFQTIEDLIEEAKKRPVTIATSRYPHPSTLAALILAEETGAQFNIISYGGGSATRTAGITGEVDAVTSFLSSSLDLASELKFLIMFNDENKWKDISDDAPTPKEAFNIDMPSLGANRAWAVQREFIEKYPERYELLKTTLEKTMNDPAVAEEFKKVGMDPGFLQFLNEEQSMKEAEAMLKIVNEYGELLKGKE